MRCAVLCCVLKCKTNKNNNKAQYTQQDGAPRTCSLPQKTCPDVMAAARYDGNRPTVSRESSVYSISLHDSQSELIRTWHRLAKRVGTIICGTKWVRGRGEGRLVSFLYWGERKTKPPLFLRRMRINQTTVRGRRFSSKRTCSPTSRWASSSVFGRGDRVGCPLGWFNEPKNRINRFVSLLLNVCLRNCEEWSPIFGGKSNTFQQKRLTGELKLSIGRN